MTDLIQWHLTCTLHPLPDLLMRAGWGGRRHGVSVEQRHVRLSGSSDPAQSKSVPRLPGLRARGPGTAALSQIIIVVVFRSWVVTCWSLSVVVFIYSFIIKLACALHRMLFITTSFATVSSASVSMYGFQRPFKNFWFYFAYLLTPLSLVRISERLLPFSFSAAISSILQSLAR